MITIQTDKINLTIPQGQIIGLFGENGAGKTTLMRCILGVTDFNGEITLDGEPVWKENVSRLAYASSESTLFPELNMKEHCRFFQEQFDKFNMERYEALIEFFGLQKYVRKPIGKLSTGQRNQFETILALSQGADYIFLDEPFSGNDVFNREDFYKVLLGLLEDNETIVLSTHLIEETQHFIDRVVLIKDGKTLDDVSVGEIEESGLDIMTYIKKKYEYVEDRVSNVMGEL